MLTIALVGRTNVGKSTLFNRIIGAARALTSSIPHTTRDRNVGETLWRGVSIKCIDTGGIEELRGFQKKIAIEEEIRGQAALASQEADLIIFVIDARDGILAGERSIARDLRHLGKPIIVACNKAETKRLRDGCLEYASLGFGDPVPTSAVTGMGIGDLLDRIVKFETENEDVKADTAISNPMTRVAIVGEPNAGKSSLLNAILGRKEVIVQPEPFTTRDTHDAALEVGGQRIILIDTAGIRRLAVRAARGAPTMLGAIERLAARRSLAAIERSEAAVLVLDATRPATKHVKQLAEAIADAGRACVIVVNKIDLVPPADRKTIADSVHAQLAQFDWAPVIATVAPKNIGVRQIIPTAIRAAAAWRRLLAPEELARIHALVKRRIPTARTAAGRKKSDIVELAQIKEAPPVFLLRTRRRVILPKAIPAIVERAIRESADFEGTPIRISIKSIKG